MKIDLTLPEAEHLLQFNTGYLSCQHPDCQKDYPASDCKYNKTAREKIRLAIKNYLINQL